jgi:RNA polymerase sigma-70 factor (ECF subfamily)
METILTAALSPGREQAEVISAQDFDQLMRQHQRRVYRVIFLLVRDDDLADVLTQECFLRAYQKLSSFRGDCRVETWLLRIAVNLVRDHGKSRRNSFWRRLVGLEEEQAENKFSLVAAEPSPEANLLAREQLKEVWKALDSVSAQQRTIFLLRFAEEMSLAEIADVLGLATGSVKAQLFRATGKVREIVRKTNEDNSQIAENGSGGDVCRL